MPPRKSKDQPALPGAQSTAELHAVLWRAADKLRGSMDASQYKDFALGLVFLKYVSDAFAERRDQIRAELLADAVPESRLDQYVGASEVDDGDDEPTTEKIDRLTRELFAHFAHFAQSTRLEQIVCEQLGRLDA
jgi:type I restriction-modification system DNA methylase subunit